MCGMCINFTRLQENLEENNKTFNIFYNFNAKKRKFCSKNKKIGIKIPNLS